MRRKKKVEPVITAQSKDDDKILDVNATMQGTLRFDDPVNLRISGKFEGTLDTKGKLMIGTKAIIRANITGEDIQVAGSISGNIKASKRLKLASTAKLIGDIETPKLAVDDGAIVMGQIRMEASSRRDDNSFLEDFMNVEEVASYLEVDSGKISDWANSGMLPGTAKNGEWVFEKNKVDEWVAQGRSK